MPVNLCYTQKVREFQQKEVKYFSKSTKIHLKRPKHQCPHCGATAVTIEPIRIRRIRGKPLGSCRKVILEFTIHRFYCNSCHHRGVEHIPCSRWQKFFKFDDEFDFKEMFSQILRQAEKLGRLLVILQSVLLKFSILEYG